MREITQGMIERFAATFASIFSGKSLTLHGGRRAQLKQLRDAMQPKTRRQLARAWKRHK